MTSLNVHFFVQWNDENRLIIWRKNYKIIVDRAEAIKPALNFAKSDDIVLIAGKGAENYIEENGEKIPYSDKSEIEKFRR